MGFEINSRFPTPRQACDFEEHTVDILIADLNLPGMGMNPIEMVYRRWPDIQPIVLTGFGDFTTASMRCAWTQIF